MRRLLITGSSGLLGLNLALHSQELGWEARGWHNQHPLNGAPFQSRAVNMAETAKLPALLEAERPDLLINCAAVANIDQAEKNPALAWTLNAEVPGILAETTKRLGIPFIHISTDAVFDGLKGDYRETDAPNPINHYAENKLAGEKAVLSANEAAIVARVVFFGWSLSGQRSLAEFFYNNLIAGKTMMGFTDMIFTPLYVRHLADLLLEMAQKELSGLYHVFGNQALSKYTFGVSLAREFGLDESLVSPHLTEDLPQPAARSLNLEMNIGKLEAALGHPLPGVTEGLAALKSDLDNGWRERILAMGR